MGQSVDLDPKQAWQDLSGLGLWADLGETYDSVLLTSQDKVC
jgi:hypothetical protein